MTESYFIPYQDLWIDDESDIKAAEKSRRTGFTYGSSYRMNNKCLKREAGFTQWVSSRDMLTARELITDYVARWAKISNAAAKGLDGDNVQVVDEEKGIKAFIAQYEHGPRIVSLSSTPEAFAGKGGDVFLDEVDLHKDPGALIDMALPCIMWGGQLEMVSAYSPTGSPQSVWAKLIEEAKTGGNPKGISLHRVTIEDAISQGIVEKINEVRAQFGKKPMTRKDFRESCEAKCRTMSAYLSQYMCVPNSSAGGDAVRPQDLEWATQDYPIIRRHFVGDAGVRDKVDPVIQNFVISNIWRELLDSARRFALGYDVARITDLASVWINECSPDPAGEASESYRLRGLWTFGNVKYESQKLFIKSAFDSLPGLIGCGDETGNGGPNCEWLEDNIGKQRFVGVNFSAFKATLGGMLREVYEKHRQIIPYDPKEIAADIAGIKEDRTTKRKRVTFVETQNPHNPASHCDMGWSDALALFAASEFPGAGRTHIRVLDSPPSSPRGTGKYSFMTNRGLVA